MMERNKALAATFLEASTKIQASREEEFKDAGMKRKLEQAQKDTAIARMRWRIMKSVVEAVIVGSGVDWAQNELLRNLVLNNEAEIK